MEDYLVSSTSISTEKLNSEMFHVPERTHGNLDCSQLQNRVRSLFASVVCGFEAHSTQFNTHLNICSSVYCCFVISLIVTNQQHLKCRCSVIKRQLLFTLCGSNTQFSSAPRPHCRAEHEEQLLLDHTSSGTALQLHLITWWLHTNESKQDLL